MTHAPRHVLFGGFTAVLLGVHTQTVRSVIDLSRNNDTASHLVSIPFVTLALLDTRRDSLFAEVLTPFFLALQATEPA
jgi:hypothetical protein